MDIVFWDHQDVQLMDFLTHGVTVNAIIYCTMLDLLRKAICKKRPRLLSNGVMLLHDNAKSFSNA